jgi:NAD(P)-dependent dehydrogenase (short-subunit alcohol dehydrogenase family)
VSRGNRGIGLEVVRRCDILINNAAVHYDAWETATRTDFRIVHEALETNVVGAWRLAAALVPLMREGRYGRIVNVSSEAGSLAGMGTAAPACDLISEWTHWRLLPGRGAAALMTSVIRCGA